VHRSRATLAFGRCAAAANRHFCDGDHVTVPNRMLVGATRLSRSGDKPRLADVRRPRRGHHAIAAALLGARNPRRGRFNPCLPDLDER